MRSAERFVFYFALKIIEKKNTPAAVAAAVAAAPTWSLKIRGKTGCQLFHTSSIGLSWIKNWIGLKWLGLVRLGLNDWIKMARNLQSNPIQAFGNLNPIQSNLDYFWIGLDWIKSGVGLDWIGLGLKNGGLVGTIFRGIRGPSSQVFREKTTELN